MALTEMERKELQSVLDRTGAHREAGKKEKVVPDDYLAYGNLVTRETVLVEVPSVNVPVECYITKAKDRQPGCPVHVNMHGGGFVFLQTTGTAPAWRRKSMELWWISIMPAR